VRIAILDSGIDQRNHYVPGQRLRGILNACSVAETGVVDDTCGHGTHVAALVNRFAPLADVYIAKVTVDGNHVEDKALANVCALEVLGS